MLCTGIDHRMIYACARRLLIDVLMYGVGDAVKLVIFCTCFECEKC
jgi:hypothetical protein